jgi:crotonobetainyl-CoA:carnitine CoA-transferase CaiB-like acyl-CoA transferase
MTLADFGAEVIKVEAPIKGDDFRYYPPADPELPAQGAPYLWTNRNKRSIGLDMKTRAGLEVAKALIASADVLVENFSTGVMERFGLDYEACRALNPGLIYCSVSAYGRSGPYADRLGFDPIAQAESGFISMNGYSDRQGVRSGAAAILMTGFGAMQHLTTGYEPQRNGNTSPDTCPSGVFQCQDMPFYVNCGNDGIFVRLFDQVLERPDIAHDPVLSKRNGRLEQRELLFGLMNEAFAQQPWSHWQPRLRAAGVPSGPVRTLAQALASDEARSRKLVTRIPHPVKGWIPNIATPLRLSRTPAIPSRAAPAVGADTERVLRETLRLDAARIAQLRAGGAFGAADVGHGLAGVA